MAFECDDVWIWDFWFAEDSGTYHMFHLEAPRSLGDPDLRHHHASVGHATSTDLVNWTRVGQAIGPGPAGSWDDVATWTGSVIRHDGRWHMFYTGASSAEDALVQRIGLAQSDDLISWTKHPANPIFEVDATWYETLDLDAWHDQAWRDPWVYPVDGGFEMVLTARAAAGPADGRGVIGVGHSKNLIDWVAAPPLTVPGPFGHMEVPQRIEIAHRPFLLFSCAPQHLAEGRRPTAPESGCYLVEIDGPSPHQVEGALALVAPNLYSARAIRDPNGRWVVLGFELDDGSGGFPGRVGDPIALEVAAPQLAHRIGADLW
jgi:beta-fructofuranosidase